MFGIVWITINAHCGLWNLGGLLGTDLVLNED